ncbi:ABC transporter substrate-binding protein [Paenibacillus macerans]|uniref:ABC transporter substrate-binding protein n=1 Tax=Paenibacillus macerans TaxID=44252 RepID=A0A090ZIP1_PAEMA|nr:ABC transporter substrate-binding protein [Paenibacillus macerans]KFN11209.1 NMT1-like family protein [Paenibacillus macerans]MCY7560268.1 ABC transporter substrate-binding protein [Paenibacillus macerans]MEC0151322.1 ABC transporter substrate-binding protein [Paenibacillus macerans]MEC0328835.1 ABC transporter substrate-binding protein [Paenibacillus macerans]MUG25632.1 ABC transporter substrate-binding protein [Paenibacillus macerans]
MKKRITLPLLLALALAGGLLAGCGGKKDEPTAEAAPGGEKLKKIVIAEPVHSTGYLPLYLAQREGYFQKRGLDVEVIQASGGAHVTAVVSGDAWGVIGGTESNALANNKNSDPIVSVVNVVNRANVYLVAKKGLAPKSGSEADLKEFFQGKKINAGRHGGTPNLLIRYLLLYLGLDPEKDVTLLEPADASTVVTMVQQGAADIGNGAEPQISDGISKDVWGEPFYKFHDFGDFSYSVLSVKKSTIANDPETVQKFVDAIKEALNAVNNDKELAQKNMKAEFPTLSDEAIQASLDRAYEDSLWSRDGFITEAAVKQDMDVLIKTGIFKGDYAYDQLVDMQFVNKSK